MNLAKVTVAVGAGLVVLGIIGFVGSGASSVTALIPSVFGAVLAVVGVLAERTDMRMVWMHVAVVLAVVGILGSAMGLAELPALVTGDTSVERPWAVAAQSIMAVVLIVYLVLAVRSFVAARRSGAAV